MRGITKAFPGVLANDRVDLTVEKQSIHCLLGENGSGKTTLMNMLFGLYHKDAGEIYINEKHVEIKSPADATRLGIGMVHQHFMLINQLTVWENVILGKEPGRLTIDRAEAKRRVQEIVDKYHFKLDIDKKACELSIGMKQRAEIVKLLYKGAEIIIFDEPTAVLTPQETEELFSIMRGLVEKGKTIIFITHKLNEIFEASDRVTVLRRGVVTAGAAETQKCSAEELAMWMVGRSISEITVGKQDNKENEGETVLSVENMQLLPGKGTVSFSLRGGEILGVAGVDGNGQMELEECIVGIRKTLGGTIRICDTDVSNASISDRKKLGVGYIPSDRIKNGIMPSMTLDENFLLGFQDDDHYKKGIFIDKKALDRDAEGYIRDYEIKTPSADIKAATLSGGNQQKVVLAREVSKHTRLIIAAQPIRGLDIGAIEYIHKVLLRLRGENNGILLISAELPELMDMCDRIIVLSDGRISAEFERGAFSETKIGLAMMGGKERAANEQT